MIRFAPSSVSILIVELASGGRQPSESEAVSPVRFAADSEGLRRPLARSQTEPFPRPARFFNLRLDTWSWLLIIVSLRFIGSISKYSSRVRSARPSCDDYGASIEMGSDTRWRSRRMGCDYTVFANISA